MAPDSPLKRPSPADSFDDGTDGPSWKRRRTDSYSSRTTRAESIAKEREDGDNGATIPKISVLPSENEEMDLTLKRSIALALKHVGFESASKEALESFMLLTDSYVSKLLSGVLLSMTTCRRTLPIPQDYEHAFEQMQIDPSSLVPHTKLPHDLPLLPPQYEPQEPLPPRFADHSALLPPELSGTIDREARKYIPKTLPKFPAVHTYRHTWYYPVEREQDPSKIREKAAEDRRNVEKILHKRLDEGKAQRRNVNSNQSDRVKKTNKLWELAMGGETGSGEKGVGPKVVIVNASKKYSRKARPTTKKPSAETNGTPALKFR